MMVDTTHECGGDGATATGGRAHNEDAWLAQFPVFIVADGMGGHVAGAAASEAVVDAFRPLVGNVSVSPHEVLEAVSDAQQAVLRLSAQEGASAGSTLTGAVLVEHEGTPWWMVINVGDSRCYAMANGTMHQVTVDHSKVQELVDDGQITAQQARSHPQRNVITRAVGDGGSPADAWLVRATPGLRLIMASDGLTNELEDHQIRAIAALAGTPSDTATRLVEAAVAVGARDNVTVVVADNHALSTPDEATPEPWLEWPEQAHAETDEITLTSARRRSNG